MKASRKSEFLEYIDKEMRQTIITESAISSKFIARSHRRTTMNTLESSDSRSQESEETEEMVQRSTLVQW